MRPSAAERTRARSAGGTGQGAPNKVIARQLQMTENTVKFHLKKVFQKLQIQNRAEALQAARARGLLT